MLIQERAVVGYSLKYMTSLAPGIWLDFQSRYDLPPLEWVLSPIRKLLVTTKV